MTGVGRRSIKNQLILKYPDTYASALSGKLLKPTLSKSQHHFGRERTNVKEEFFFHCILKEINPFNFHDGDLYHVETSPLICSTIQWFGLYIIGTSLKKELRRMCPFCEDQSVDLFCRSMDWILLNGNTGLKRFINLANIYLFKASNRKS